MLTASTSGEDAQESDQLAGSVFTHYLLSALHGVADENNDQIVTVAEAFAHTREQTILASSRSRGRDEHAPATTNPRALAVRHGVPSALDPLVMRCMVKDPELRFTAPALVNAIDALLQAPNVAETFQRAGAPFSGKPTLPPIPTRPACRKTR